MLILGCDELIAAWTEDRLGLSRGCLSPSAAMGICIKGKLVAGVVFNAYRPADEKSEATIEATIASTDPNWCTRRHLAGIFDYPFRQLNCRRLHAITEATNQPARAFLCRLGFKEEGILHGAYRAGDGVLHAMLREECKWITRQKENSLGEKLALSSSRT